jgi:hypothetical protein
MNQKFSCNFLCLGKGDQNVEKENVGLRKLLSSATPDKCFVHLRTGHDTFLLLPSPLTIDAWWGSMGWTTEELFDSRQGQDIEPSRPAGQRDLFPVVKRLGREACHSPPCSVEDKN